MPDAADAAWGVFAAEGPGLRLEAVADGAGAYVLNGSKPWCSLAAQLDGAVVTAHLRGAAAARTARHRGTTRERAGGRAAFAVSLHAPGVSCETPQWTSRGLREIPSGTVHFDGVSAVPVGGPGWYFQRPGFAWGGMGVAACWFGGAVAVARDFRSALAAAADKGREPDQIALAHLGETDRILTSLSGYLARTAERIDAGGLSGSGAWSEALRVRGTVAAAVERVQSLVAQNLGPGPLAFNEAYGKRMADLSLYIRQHHAMRDDAQLGALTLKGDRVMVTFSHADAGTAESEWEASGLAVLPELPLDAGELAAMTFIVLAAHPDDETLGAGGFLSRLHAAGAAVDVLLCTAGEASHPESRTTTPEQLAAVRLGEFGAAVSGLVPAASWRFLHLTDGQLAADRHRIAAAVREATAASGRPANQVAIVAPYRSDGHADHDALGSVAAEVAAEDGHGLLEYPVWYWLWASPADKAWQSWVRVPLTPDEQRAKAAAMRAHASQTQPLSGQPGDEALLSGAFLEHFSRPWETFAWHGPAGGTNSAGDAERIFDAVHGGSADPWELHQQLV